MNKEVLRQFANLEKATEELLHAIHYMREALDNEKKEKIWFNNGKIIINGVEYPVQNFTVEWKHET